MTRLTIYTDGCCLKNPGGPGGCAAIIEHPGHVDRISRGYARTTNNRMELQAVIMALYKVHEPSEITLYTDSMVVVYGVNAATAPKKRKTPRANDDQWQEYHRLAAKHRITAVWVKGHNGHPENEICDRMAAKAARDMDRLKIDRGFECLGELFG